MVASRNWTRMLAIAGFLVASAVSATATTATAIIALRHRLGFVNSQCAAVELGPIQAFYRFLSFAAGAHLDKTETA